MCQYISLLGEIKWWKLENYKVKGFLSYTRLKHYSYGHSHCKIHILHWLHSQITSQSDFIALPFWISFSAFFYYKKHLQNFCGAAKSFRKGVDQAQTYLSSQHPPHLQLDPESSSYTHHLGYHSVFQNVGPKLEPPSFKLFFHQTQDSRNHLGLILFISFGEFRFNVFLAYVLITVINVIPEYAQL